MAIRINQHDNPLLLPHQLVLHSIIQADDSSSQDRLSAQKKNPDIQSPILRWQSVIIPACFGDYEVIQQVEGECEAVIQRWKE